MIWICKVEIPVHLAVVKLHCDCVVCFLIDGPYNSGQIQAYANQYTHSAYQHAMTHIDTADCPSKEYFPAEKVHEQ